MKNRYNTNNYNKDLNVLDSETLNKFYEGVGWLSKYSLSCGYMEYIEIDDNRISLFADECYQVKKCNKSGVVIWETFTSLFKARQYFKRVIKATYLLQNKL